MQAIGKFVVATFLLLLGAVLIAGCTALHARTTIVGEEQTFQEKWANVESQYQRRMDLMPNLANAVKAYAKQESDIWKQFAAARSTADVAAKDVHANPGDNDRQVAFLKAQEQLTVKINAVREAYPQLKSDALFARYMDELTGTENRINVARERYNEAVSSYNKSVGVWASFFGYRTKSYYQADAEASKAPVANF